jgi:hypothetical protein
MYGIAAGSESRPAASDRLLADRDAADSPAVACLDALPDRVANADVALVGIVSVITIGSVIARPPAEPAAKPAAVETTTVETAATVTTVTAKGER